MKKLTSGLVVCSKEEKLFQNQSKLFAGVHAATVRFKTFESMILPYSRIEREKNLTSFFNCVESGSGKGKLSTFAFVGHGIESGLPAASLYRYERRGAKRFSEKLKVVCKPGADIILYACSAGKLGNSFANVLSSYLPGYKVYGHFSTGTTIYNPDLTVFPPGKKLRDVILGELKFSKVFQFAWNKAISSRTDNLWAKFFLMSHEDLLSKVIVKPLQDAAEKNKKLMKTVGWQYEIGNIRKVLGCKTESETEIAKKVSFFQAKYLKGRWANGQIDGKTWRSLKKFVTLKRFAPFGVLPKL